MSSLGCLFAKNGFETISILQFFGLKFFFDGGTEADNQVGLVKIEEKTTLGLKSALNPGKVVLEFDTPINS